MPYFLAIAAVESWLPPTSDVTSTPGMRLSASRCFWPKAPWPATQIFIDDLLATTDSIDFSARGSALHLGRGFLALARRLCRGLLRTLDAVFQNDVADRGVRRRYGVEAIDLVHLLIQRATHDEPHHHLDTFGA